MKRFLGLILVASLGGLVAIGLNKFFNKEDEAKFTTQHLAQYASLQEGNYPDFVAVAELVTPTVVHIITTVNTSSQEIDVENDPFGGFFKGFQIPQGPKVGSGSGVIISSDGYIVTNNHVINGASKIKVILNDKREYDAELLGADKNTDLALLRIDEKSLPFALIGNSDEVKVGQWVLAVGNPFNLTSTVTAGIVSAKGRGLNLIRDPRNQETQYAIEAFIQTDAAINPGNSGGAMVSTEGKLIGINTAIASQNGQYAGYGFAIPSNLMKKVIEDLMKFGEVQRGLLGVQIQDVNNELAEKEGLKEVKGVFVAKVNDNTAASAAGIKDKDVIISIDGQTVNSSNELQEKVGKKSPGDKVVVGLIRNGNKMELTATLRNKEGKAEVAKAEKVENNKILECDFETIPREERLKLKVSNGVRIKKVGEKSPLKKAGIPDGFVLTSIDKKPIATITDVKLSLKDHKGGVLMEGINPSGSKGYYAFGIE
ncbi:MAG: Do family serine endopeptidase [Bacteroidia bacterium]|nr:Do family serine endopeptidase [Bacteroidia bacterium]MCF8426220.1 Do family serine endopeptidase [Bacteroidia bacterium]